MYLHLLHQHCQKHDVRIAGYCLMTNHVHLVAIPRQATGLAKALGRTHTDYSRWLNMNGETGHVWQNRFYSCPLDEPYRWDALCYVELNPVRAGMVQEASEWPWSSAAAHAAGIDPTGILELGEWSRRWSPATWRDALEHGVRDAALLERIRITP